MLDLLSLNRAKTWSVTEAQGNVCRSGEQPVQRLHGRGSWYVGKLTGAEGIGKECWR